MARGQKAQELDNLLKPLREKLESWRCKHKGERIPEELWREATRAAGKHGVSAVSYRLHLGYYRLRARLERSWESKENDREVVTFAEAKLPQLSWGSSNSIELIKANGSKLRIECSGECSVELARLSERLWRAAK